MVIKCNRHVNAWRVVVVIRIFTVVKVNVTFTILGKHLNQYTVCPHVQFSDIMPCKQANKIYKLDFVRLQSSFCGMKI
jgi:hypothetical protein